MATPARSRRDFAALEARRFQAARLFARGESQGAVARALGVTPVTAHHWYHAWHANGRAGLQAAGNARAGAARGAARVRIQHGPLDAAPCGDGHRAPDAGAPSSGACVAHPARLELVPAAAGTARPGARRGSDRAVEDAAVGAGKKNARRQSAWIVFEDESGVSQQPVVRRTW